MPPPRPSAIDRIRRDLLEEPIAPQYFPDVPIGGGRTLMSDYISPQAANYYRKQRVERDLFFDNAETKMATNDFSRFEMDQRRQALPFATQADIARNRLVPKQVAAEEEILPYETEAAIQQRIQQMRASESAGRVLPSAEAATIQENERRAAGEDELKQLGIDPLAYDYHLRTIDKNLPAKERQRQAKNATLRLQNDAPYVAAIEDEALESGDPEFRKKYLQDDRDPETGARFTRVRDDVDVGEVNALLRKRAYTKEQKARDEMELKAAREERIANAQFDGMRLKALNEAKATALVTAKDDNSDPAAKQAALDELTRIDAAIKDIALKPIERPARTKTGAPAKADAPPVVPSAAPAVAPAVEKPAPPTAKSTLDKWKETFKK